MAQRKFLILSCVLLVTAIVCHWTYLHRCGRTMELLSTRMPEKQHVEAWADAQRMLDAGSRYALGGCVAAGLGLGLGIAARRRREGRWTLVPFLLLIAYGVSLCLIV